MSERADVRWNKRVSLKLIAEYKKRPILWNRTKSSFFCPKDKQNAWKVLCKKLRLSEKVKVTVKDVKEKIANLKRYLRRERAKEKGAKRGRKRPYVSPWFAYEALTFLYEEEESEIVDIMSNDGNNIEPSVGDIQDATNQPSNLDLPGPSSEAGTSIEFQPPKKPTKKRKRQEREARPCRILGERVADITSKFNDRLFTVAQDKVMSVLSEVDKMHDEEEQDPQNTSADISRREDPSGFDQGSLQQLLSDLHIQIIPCDPMPPPATQQLPGTRKYILYEITDAHVVPWNPPAPISPQSIQEHSGTSAIREPDGFPSAYLIPLGILSIPHQTSSDQNDDLAVLNGSSTSAAANTDGLSLKDFYESFSANLLEDSNDMNE